jgi:hypothetical protein
LPGINIKVSGCTVQAFIGKINKRHSDNYNIENSMPERRSEV